MSFGITGPLFAASIPGEGFTGFLYGDHRPGAGRCSLRARRLAAGPVPDAAGAQACPYAGIVMVVGALIVGSPRCPGATAFRVYLSEQFPTALSGHGHFFGESGESVRRALWETFDNR